MREEAALYYYPCDGSVALAEGLHTRAAAHAPGCRPRPSARRVRRWGEQRVWRGQPPPESDYPVQLTFADAMGQQAPLAEPALVRGAVEQELLKGHTLVWAPGSKVSQLLAGQCQLH